MNLSQTDRDLMQQALDALSGVPFRSGVRDALRARLAAVATSEPSNDQVIAALRMYDKTMEKTWPGTSMDRFVAMQEAIKAAFL